ncbi:MAG: molybdopterin dinucleotide binding domain-containing protein [Candidatus Thorarchaeota archaeon]|jgi:formylmethanofuran dehydrogenase subunit D
MSLGDFLFPQAELKLVIAHSFETDIESVRDKMSAGYLQSAARVSLSTGNLKRLGLKEGDAVSVESRAGKVVVNAFPDDKLEEGLAVMPRSPWALSLVAVPPDGESVQLHGIPVTVTKSNDKVTSLDSILEPR